MLTLDDIADRIERMEGFPMRARELAALVDPGVSTRELEQILRPGAGLTANVLGMANLVHFGALTPLASASDAVVRLGPRLVAELAMAGSFRSVMPCVLPGYETSAEDFWRHSVAVALFADRIGKRTSPGEPYFGAGLLHDMGKLVVGEFVVGREQRAKRSFGTGERELLSTDHCEAGLELARQWRLPVIIGAAAAWHHAPMEAPASIRKIACAVHVADGLAYALGFGARTGGISCEVQTEACAALSLDDHALATLCEGAAEELASLGDVLAGLPQSESAVSRGGVTAPREESHGWSHSAG